MASDEIVVTLRERAARALPCLGPCVLNLLTQKYDGHILECPARLRPAVEAAMRELVEECAQMASRNLNDLSAAYFIRRLAE